MAVSGTQVVRRASEHAEWEFVTRPPAAPLAGHVRRYLGYWERHVWSFGTYRPTREA